MATIGIDARSMFGTPTGVGRYLSNVLHQLQYLDHENSYYLYTDCTAEQSFSQHAHFVQKSLRLPFAHNYFTWNHFRLPPELLWHPVDIFHFPFYTIPLIRNYKTIVTIHDITYEVHPEWYSWKGVVATRFFSKYAARHADVVIADSQNTKQDLLRYYRIPAHKVVVIKLAVEERFRQITAPRALTTVRERYHLTASRIILYVGSIHTRRNIETLIRAFHSLQPHRQDLQLVLVGKQEYPYLDLSALIKELALQQRVVLPGYVPENDLPLLYNVADLFIYPSSYEGFGLPPLEAMACGTPVITSNVTSLPEVTGDAAMLIQPTNGAEMVDAMHQVLTNTALQHEMSTRGVARAALFSWEKTAQETLAVYRRLGA